MSRLFSGEIDNTLSFGMLSLDISQCGMLLCLLDMCGIRVYMAGASSGLEGGLWTWEAV